MGGWKDYIAYMGNEGVTETSHIFGLDGSVWASSTGLAAVIFKLFLYFCKNFYLF